MDNSSLPGAGPASAGLAQAHSGGPASSLSPTSPVSVRSQVFAHNGSNGGAKRKRSSVAMMGDSPESDDDDATGEHSHEKKRQPGVKRACNECRQQKVCLTQCCVPVLSAPLSSPLISSSRQLQSATRGLSAPCPSYKLLRSLANTRPVSCIIVAMRCRARSLPELFSVCSSQAGLQDRVQL